MVRALAESLRSSQTVSFDVDRIFIAECLDNDDSDLVPFIANLLRSGGLRKAVEVIGGASRVVGRPSLVVIFSVCIDW
jgi:hypothetical protein